MRNPNGFGNVCKLSGKRRRPFMARRTVGFDADGKQLYAIIGYFEKRAEAIEALSKFNLSGNTLVKHTFKMVYEAFCEEKYTSLSKPIPATYSSAYKKAERLYKASFREIRLADLEAIMSLAPSYNTKRDIKVLLQQMYKYAIRHEIVDKNIAQSLQMPPAKKSEKHHPFIENEIIEMWRHKEDLEAKLWLIYIYTGLRPSELILITTENVHLKEKYMIGGIKNNYSIDRIIPIADCILPFITYFYTPSSQYLITVNGQPIDYDDLQKMLVKYANKLGMKHTCHDGRHTFASLMDNLDDVKLTLIQSIMGHSGDSVTEKVYIHKSLPKMLQAVNKLSTYQDSIS